MEVTCGHETEDKKERSRRSPACGTSTDVHSGVLWQGFVTILRACTARGRAEHAVEERKGTVLFCEILVGRPWRRRPRFCPVAVVEQPQYPKQGVQAKVSRSAKPAMGPSEGSIGGPGPHILSPILP